MAELDAGNIFKQMKLMKNLTEVESPLFPGQTDGKVWITKQGERISVTEMSDKHIANSVAMLKRAIESRKQAIDQLNNEVSRRQLIKAQEAQKKRRMSTMIQNNGRMIRDED